MIAVAEAGKRERAVFKSGEKCLVVKMRGSEGYSHKEILSERSTWLRLRYRFSNLGIPLLLTFCCK